MTDSEQPGAIRDQTQSSAPADEDERRAIKAANRFDIRRIIAALFTIYGVILVITGIVGSHHVKTKAVGINIDLWAGIAMLIFAAIMVAWALLRPVRPEQEEAPDAGSGGLQRAPAT